MFVWLKSIRCSEVFYSLRTPGTHLNVFLERTYLSKREQPVSFYSLDCAETGWGWNPFVSSENLEPHSSPLEIGHPEVGRYFSEFAETHYVANEELQTRYPEDTGETLGAVQELYHRLSPAPESQTEAAAAARNSHWAMTTQPPRLQLPVLALLIDTRSSVRDRLHCLFKRREDCCHFFALKLPRCSCC